MYDETEYKVGDKTYTSDKWTRKYDDNPILTHADVEIKGAKFKVDRVFTKLGNPSRVFLFRTDKEFNSNGELIEIGWDTCSSGLMKIANELNLKFVSGSSIFGNGNSRCHFIEDENNKAVM